MQSQAFLDLLDKMRETHIAKSNGYSGKDNPDTWANFRESKRFGVTPFLGCLIRLSDKFVRISNLVRDNTNDTIGESLEDTLIDMASYCLIAICLLRETHDNK
jgi:hypothetical protein